MKLLSKIIATRISRFLADVIGPDQAGFMPGRETCDNVITALNLIHSLRGEGLR